MIRFLKQYYPIRTVVLFIGESLLILIGFSLVTTIRLFGAAYLFDHLWTLLLKSSLVMVVCQLILYYNDLYKIEPNGCPVKLGLKLIQSLGLTSMILAIVCSFAPMAAINYMILFSNIYFIGILVYVWRILINLIFNKRKLTQQILIIGSGHLAQNVAREIMNRENCGFEILGFLGKDAGDIGKSILNPKVLGTYEQLDKILKKNGGARVVVALDDKRGNSPLKELLRCKMEGISIEDHITFLEKLTGKLMVESLNPSHLIFSDGFKKSKVTMYTKRMLDIGLSIVALAVLSPIILLVAILIKMDSKGSLFFKQERVGQNEKIFTIYKFRSMKTNSEERGAAWAKENDDRVTRVGRYIRKFGLDEVPQLWNVLKGDMSLVGPRPERSCFVEQLTTIIPYYGQRHTVKPGITGWAQIKYQYGASIEDAIEKLKYELYYIKNISPLFDLSILFETVKRIILGKISR